MGIEQSIPCGTGTIPYDGSNISPLCHVGDLVNYRGKLYIVAALSKYECAMIYALPMTEDNTINFEDIPSEDSMLLKLRAHKGTHFFLYPSVKNLELLWSCPRSTWDQCITNMEYYWTTSGLEAKFKAKN